VLTPELVGGFVGPNAGVRVDPCWRQLTRRASNRVEEEELAQFMRASLTEPLARAALRDLTTAIGAPFDTTFAAYRAVESVRQYFVDDANEDRGHARELSWEAMRDALAQERDPLDWLRSCACACRGLLAFPQVRWWAVEDLNL
jgi:hypothetical protein